MSPPGARDAFIENHINAWDCLAGNLLVAEAGGYVSDFLANDGLRKGNALLACAPGLARPLLAIARAGGRRFVNDVVSSPAATRG